MGKIIRILRKVLIFIIKLLRLCGMAMFKCSRFLANNCITRRPRDTPTRRPYRAPIAHRSPDTYPIRMETTPLIAKQSKGNPQSNFFTERKLQTWLESRYGGSKCVLTQVKFNWCRSDTTNKHLPFDFVLLNYNIIIELDGDQHFKQVKDWRSPEQTLKYDRFKAAMALTYGYTLIRVLQMDVYKDSNNWEYYLTESIKKYSTPMVIYPTHTDLYKDHQMV